MGDTSILEEIRHRVASAVRRACPGWSRDETDDFVQSILTALAQRMKAAPTPPTWSRSYLDRMAHGVVVDELRRRARRPVVAVDGPELDRNPSGVAPPDRALHSTEIARGIRDCVLRLIAPRRRAVALHLLGCGIAEVARRTGWSAKRAENMIYRGLADVRRCLEAKGLAP